MRNGPSNFKAVDPHKLDMLQSPPYLGRPKIIFGRLPNPTPTLHPPALPHLHHLPSHNNTAPPSRKTSHAPFSWLR